MCALLFYYLLLTCDDCIRRYLYFFVYTSFQEDAALTGSLLKSEMHTVITDFLLEHCHLQEGDRVTVQSC